MKIYTSYFYKVRFFKPNYIPLSTAKWDPRWYNNFEGQGKSFIDKNNVINGLRAYEFVPGEECNFLCNGYENCKFGGDPESCTYLNNYRCQLSNLDIDKVINRLQCTGQQDQKLIGFTEEPVFVFLVYEKPDNKCSERAAIQDFFKDNGIECEELEI